MSETVISVENLSKRYFIGAKEELPKTKGEAIRSIVGAPFKYLSSKVKEPNPEETFWALKDVSFEVKQGEVVGLIGRNGAGKSTLLKILSRITKPTSGCAKIRGRVGSLLEVGTGFHPELTGRENIYLNGTILGMTKKEIDKKFDEIVDFAEIEKFLDTPVKRYSSGMYIRLAFAVAAHLEPEILVIDEVLAVGDIQFQKKCLGKIEDVSTKEGKTVLFVSHNMAAIRSLCKHAVLLSKGKVIINCDVESGVSHYIANDEITDSSVIWNKENAPQSPELRFIKAYILNERGETVSNLDCRKSFSIVIEYEVLRTLKGLRIGFFLQSFEGIPICGSNDPDAWSEWIRKPGYYTSQCIFPGWILNRGQYTVCFGSDMYPYARSLVSTPYCLSFMIEDMQGHGSQKEKLPGIIRPQLAWSIKHSTN